MECEDSHNIYSGPDATAQRYQVSTVIVLSMGTGSQYHCRKSKIILLKYEEDQITFCRVMYDLVKL